MRFLTYDGLDPGRHRDAFDRLRAAIERDDWPAVGAEKLAIGPYYKVKLGYAERLIVHFVEHGGAKACVALEILEHHEYERSRFARRGARFEASKVDEASGSASAPVTPDALVATPIAFLHPTRATITILDKLVSFDDAQEQALRAPCPLLLVGSAGSGKTAVALQKMRTLRGDVAYVTRSDLLAERARETYFAFGAEPPNQRADFRSVAEVLDSIRVPAGKPMTQARFAAWFARHRDANRFASAHQAFEEIRGVVTASPAGPLTRQAYLSLGPRQSIFVRDDRERLYEVYEKYRALMKEEGLHDPNLVAHDYLALAKPRFDFLVVDEVQDLTPVELALLLRLGRTPGNFVVTGDANQIVHPSFFSWSALKSLLFSDDKGGLSWSGVKRLFGAEKSLADRVTLTILDAGYRNASAVTEVANALLKVKHARFGSVDRESSALIRASVEEVGEVCGLASASPQVLELDASTARSARCAVIVLRDEDKPEARKRFRTPLVFSVREAKGLEYENVVLHEIVSSARREFLEVAAGVTKDDLAANDLAFRRPKDKDDKSLELYKFFVNALFVALTRATKRVYVVESDVTHPLWQLLGVRFGEDSVPVEVDKTESTLEEWQREARRLELTGESEQADAIRTHVLKQKAVDWEVLDEEGYRAKADLALAPGSVANKAKQLLYDFACFHRDQPLADRLVIAGGHRPTATFFMHRASIIKKQTERYRAKRFDDILRETERHGVDFRSRLDHTPLHLATRACNVPLVRALLARGARPGVCDTYGLTPALIALQQGYDEHLDAREALGALWELLAPPSIDMRIGNRLYKIGRHEPEHFFFSMGILARTYYPREEGGFAAAFFLGAPFDHFPDNVYRHTWRSRDFVDEIFDRNVVGTRDPTARELWTRAVHQDRFAPNPLLELRVDAGVDNRFQPIEHLLGIAREREHVAAIAAHQERESEPRLTVEGGDGVRAKSTLKVVKPLGGMNVFRADPRQPVVTGYEDHDLVCGRCGRVVASGLSPGGLADYLAPKDVNIIKCGYCPAFNAAPKRGAVLHARDAASPEIAKLAGGGRPQTKLVSVSTNPGGTAVAAYRARPALSAKDKHDFLCGQCSAVVVQGMSEETSRSFTLAQRIRLLVCGECKSLNLAPGWTMPASP